MGQIRDSQRTRARILDAAARAFAQAGFDGAALSDIAARARVSKQLILHHFESKEKLFSAVLDARFQTTIDAGEALPDDPGEMLAERFRRRAGHPEYIRFMTWEAAGADARSLPAHAARQQRISDLGRMLRLMQAEGKLPRDLDSGLLQLAVLSLCTYPLAFGQITRLVTGRSPDEAAFQDQWADFLRVLGTRLFATEQGAAPSRRPAAKRKRATRGA